MLARLSVQSRRGMVQWREPVIRPAFWLGLGYRGFHWRSGAYPHDPWGGYYGGAFTLSERLVMRPVQNYRLRVQIADRGQMSRAQTAAPTVFDATAEYVGPPVALPTVMPYLIRAVFDDFPGQNGQIRQVVFDSKTGERLPDQEP